MRRILKQAMLVLAAAVLMMAAAGCGQQEEPAEQAAQTPPVQQEQAPDDAQEEEEQPEVAIPSLTAQIQQAQQKNEDIVGWLRIDDTEIDGAVVQGKDNEEYKRLNELYYGPDMVVDDNIAMEWARIPHFYYNYYVFQYATGYSAAIALSRRILREGAPAVKDYLGFLSGGCSKSPIDLLKGAGVDMTSPEPVNQALALFGELLDEMEELTRE